MSVRRKIIIIGAAGRDFHIFNTLFRDKPEYEVIAFTAAQIPYITDRTYPKELSGKLYPKGIPIFDESSLPKLIQANTVDECIMAYSDVSYNDLGNKASIVNASGADFIISAPEKSMIRSKKPIISVCGVRTGVGKSQTSRYVSSLLKKMGLRVVVIRHPMPYGNLKEQITERFSKLSDLEKYKTTIEEREEYEPHIMNKTVVYAGVDYARILSEAENEADIIIWDGGNNDAPFYKSDILIVVADPLRAGNELTYYPGETLVRLADILIINKANSATKDEIEKVTSGLKSINSKAKVILADSIISVDNPASIKGKSALLVEDGPTITHGNMKFGAATVAAKTYGARNIITAKEYAIGSIKETFSKYPSLSKELPAMGYSPKQIRDLEATINAADCDVVISATPTNLRHIINVNKPIVQVSYELSPKSADFDNIIKNYLSKLKTEGK